MTMLIHLPGGAARTLALAVCLVAGVASAPRVHGQNARTPPHLGYAYPAGGQIGTTFTVAVGGQNLNGTRAVHVSTPGLTATVISYERPLTQKEFNELRDELKSLQERRAAALALEGRPRKGAHPADASGEAPRLAPQRPRPEHPDAALTKAGWSPADQKRMEELREQLAKRSNRQSNPALAETVTVQLTIPANAKPGDCELRLETPAGLSNPARLQIGSLPEVTTAVVTPTQPAAPAPRKRQPAPISRAQATDTPITLPATVNGQITPGGVDRFRFEAKKGQRLTVAVSARALMPYLADAVPGWFQPTLALYAPSGEEVAYSDGYRFSPDPVVCYEVPTDGSYALEIRDSIYRGREDFVYRISIGELPFVTSLFPLGGKYTEGTTLQLAGWNLPARTVSLKPNHEGPGTFLLSVRQAESLSNSVRFALDDDPECLESEPHDSPADPQPVTSPVVIDGRIGRPGDVDVFRFEGTAGQQLVAEVFARRLGSPLDSLLRLTDTNGRPLAANDDFEDKGAGLLTHHADSRISVTLPAGGAYFLTLSDAQNHGGDDYAYRLRLAPPRPTFELRVVPSTVNVPSGGHAQLTVYALRRDGFDGEIRLSLENAPRGFNLDAARIPAGQDRVQITLSAPAGRRESGGIARVSVAGSAVIADKTVRQVAVPADDMMQAFAYHHLVPAQELLLDVVARPGLTCRPTTSTPVRLPLGGSAHVIFSTRLPPWIGDPTAELNDAPAGVTVKSVVVSKGGLDVLITCDAAKSKPGVQGNLVLNLSGQRTNDRGAKGPRREQRVSLGCAPAVPFEIVAPE